MDIISETLGIEPASEELVEYKKAEIVTTFDEEDEKEDFKTARESLHSLLENGDVALEGILRAAMESGEPRAFEVVATVMNSLASISKDLHKLHEKRDNSSSQQTTNNQVNNNLFVGSTTDLLDLLDTTADDKE